MVHVYFGEGAKDLPVADGMALRARGAGLLVGQFSADSAPVDFDSYDMVILEDCDKICAADLAKIIAGRPENTELILIGSDFDEGIIEAADLASNIGVRK
ncbi:MAG: hypothetical protein LBE35_07945 [Clostridiales bacterium]|jgi:ATP:corrinoid adenosyltransferase|nr:hypothetical protein [Clostridiales bacterium]